MYVLVIHVPFQPITPGVVRVASDWGRSLCLLRDSFAGRYGEIVVAAPTLPRAYDWSEQEPLGIVAHRDAIRFVALCPAGLRARQFWLRAPGIWRRCVTLVRRADVVHGGMSDIFRPLAQMGFWAACRCGVPTVFVEDNDTVGELKEADGRRPRHAAQLRIRLVEACTRRAVARADLSLLKGRALHERYGRYARNAKDFHDTSYARDWVIPPHTLAEKIRHLSIACELRCVALGRLIARKGVDHTLDVIHRLRVSGVPATLDVIGDGPERNRLEALARNYGLCDCVRFLGRRSYSERLVRELHHYHLLLFTPLLQETPRSLFDALAAGVAIAAYDVPYTRSLFKEVGCGVSAPTGKTCALVERIGRIWANRKALVELIRRSAEAGRLHTAEEWYRRRAEWTHEAVQKANMKSPC